MVQGLFRNKNVERILLFLFVNERCYGSQLQTLLRVPLTPVQKALLSLEKDGILHSYFEGKNRMFMFNPSYSLSVELHALLKKAYTLLPAQEKKRYCFIHKPRLKLHEERKREKGRTNELVAFWERLLQVKKLSFSAKLQSSETSLKVGKAEVLVSTPTPSIVVFQEKGFWFENQLPDTAFSNSFRWSLDTNASLITLEHLRYGDAQPVFLFHFSVAKPSLLESVDAHLCGDDTYLGNIVWSPHSIDFHWRIIGPHKNNHLNYHYT